jgi:nucleoside-diphosphate-sugar epimerase
VGVQRDDTRPAVRRAAALRPGGRGSLPGTHHDLRAVQGRQRDDRWHIAQWSRIPFVGLRFSNILGPRDYEEFPSYWPDPQLRKWNLWGYIDERDAAAACRLALDAPVEGSASFIIAAADTVMTRPSADLMREVFPGVPLTGDVSGTGTLLAIGRAAATLGFVPGHSWRDHVSQ